ncbi:hypothetical protein ABZ307_38055 [Streptomyces griseorubiginosus]|uniref:hypothetical protein n=1 Tax=Streptomyces griseorubiginosus TaxID=67304 RepID=UPI0033A1F7E7
MTPMRPVSVGPPDSQGGRLVHIRNEAVGRAYGLWDMVVFLNRAGLDLGEEDEIAASDLIEWTGGRPTVWEP